MGCCDDLKALLAPLGLYDLSAGARNEAELFALGAALDGVDAALTAAEREALVPTATDEGLARWEAALPWRPRRERWRSGGRPSAPCSASTATA